jgi:hypothetical protein
MSDETKSVLLDADGMYFGLLTHPKEEEPCDKNQLSLLLLL